MRKSLNDLGFYCENCNNPVSIDADQCPFCGKQFSAVKCPVCGFMGKHSLFKDGCPSCGYQRHGNEISPIKPEEKVLPVSKSEKLLPVWAYQISIIVLTILLIIFALYFFRKL